MQQCGEVNHPVIVSPNRGFCEFALVGYVLPFSAASTHACGLARCHSPTGGADRNW